MTRMRIAIAVALSLVGTTVHAQSTHFTVSTPTASVYKAPTNISPVIGEATRGATLEVTRDVGSWVKVAWSQAPDGVGYIRKTAGTLSALGPSIPPAAATAAGATSSASATPRAVSASTVPAAPASPSIGAAQPPAASAPQPRSGGRIQLPVPAGYVAPSHRLGIGGLVGGSALGAGFSVRGWSRSERLGVQFDVAHTSMTNEVFFTNLSSTQFGPRVLFAFRDHVSDHTWVRPYVGAGAHVLRASVSDPVTGVSTSDTRMAAQVLGGAEVTLSAAPRLGLSADVGYQWHQSPFAGYTLDGMMMTLSAHWYWK